MLRYQIATLHESRPYLLAECLDEVCQERLGRKATAQEQEGLYDWLVSRQVSDSKMLYEINNYVWLIQQQGEK